MKKVTLPTGLTVIAVLVSLALHTLWRAGHDQATRSADNELNAAHATENKDSKEIPPNGISITDSTMPPDEALKLIEKEVPATAPVVAQLKQAQSNFDRTLVTHQKLRERHTSLVLAGDENSAAAARSLELELKAASEELFNLSRRIYELTQEISESMTAVTQSKLQGDAS